MGKIGLHITPRKDARIINRKINKSIVKRRSSRADFYVRDFDKKNNLEYDFEVITPYLQIKERNKAYKFFSLK